MPKLKSNPHVEIAASNLPKLLLGLAHYMQSETLSRLAQHYDHNGLRLSFEPYIALIEPQGSRQADIANILKVSKQNCSQLIKQIEKLGYIQRIANPQDGRERLLVLTKKGKKLKQDGSDVIAQLQQQLVELCGKRAVNRLISVTEKLCAQLNIALPKANEQNPNTAKELSRSLFRLNGYVINQLLSLTIARGHPALKPSHAQVLSFVGTHHVSIQHLASANKVSKQAIGAIVNDLDNIGYISRTPNTADGRQILIQLTEQGHTLISDSISSVEELVNEFTEITGIKTLQQFQKTLQKLNSLLSLEYGANSPDIEALAQQLQQQLGLERAKQLARRILEFN